MIFMYYMIIEYHSLGMNSNWSRRLYVLRNIIKNTWISCQTWYPPNLVTIFSWDLKTTLGSTHLWSCISTFYCDFTISRGIFFRFTLVINAGTYVHEMRLQDGVASITCAELPTENYKTRFIIIVGGISGLNYLSVFSRHLFYAQVKFYGKRLLLLFRYIPTYLH